MVARFNQHIKQYFTQKISSTLCDLSQLYTRLINYSTNLFLFAARPIFFLFLVRRLAEGTSNTTNGILSSSLYAHCMIPRSFFPAMRLPSRPFICLVSSFIIINLLTQREQRHTIQNKLLSVRNLIIIHSVYCIDSASLSSLLHFLPLHFASYE